MIPHSLRPRRLARYSQLVPANATVLVGTFEVPPNQALSVAAKGDQTFTLRATHVDPDDQAAFDKDDFEVSSLAPKSAFLRASAGAIKIEIVNGATPANPDVRVYGMGQP